MAENKEIGNFTECRRATREGSAAMIESGK